MTSVEVEALRVGDKVFYDHYGDECVVKVDRRTITQVVLSNGSRINKRGQVIGCDTWSRIYVRPWTPEREAEILADQTRRRTINRLRAVRWSEIPNETLAAIVALLPAKVEP